MIALLLLGCTSATPVDTGSPPVDTEEPAGLECSVLEIRVNGEDPPHVGDTWALWLWCDDTLLLGATRIVFTPPDIASISENNATFLYAGDGSVQVQVGSRRQTLAFTVAE